jgi:hypothetical protein
MLEHKRYSEKRNKEKTVEAVFYVNDKPVTIKMNLALIGRILFNLEITREALGHTNFKSTFRYIHGNIVETPEYVFIRELLEREHYKR